MFGYRKMLESESIDEKEYQSLVSKHFDMI